MNAWNLEFELYIMHTWNGNVNIQSIMHMDGNVTFLAFTRMIRLFDKIIAEVYHRTVWKIGSSLKPSYLSFLVQVSGSVAAP